MSNYEIYSLILAIVVLVLFVATFSLIIAMLTKSTVRLIECGKDDNIIGKELIPLLDRLAGSSPLCRAFSVFTTVLIVVIFCACLFLRFTKNDYGSQYTSIKVVQSDSMENKNPDNSYLFENDINDQISMFDLIVVRPLPDEYELELYDIVVYELDGDYIVHRIVGIEEPNESHPDCRHFKLQGDAIGRYDRFPVLYDQMIAKYEGERVPFIGSFILFLQSPAGWFCMILILFTALVTPLLEKKLDQKKSRRIVHVVRATAKEKPENPIKKKSAYETVIEKTERWRKRHGLINKQNGSK